MGILPLTFDLMELEECRGCSLHNPVDHLKPECAVCGATPVLAVPCTGWRTYLKFIDEAIEHSVVYCAKCWQWLLSMRPPTALPLPAVALNAVGRQLLLRPRPIRQEPQPVAKPKRKRTSPLAKKPHRKKASAAEAPALEVA